MESVHSHTNTRMATLAVSLLCLLFLSAEVSPRKVCSQQDILDYLNLTRNNEKYTSSRPVLDWTNPTVVYLDVFLYAILSVIEKSQIFVSFMWMSMMWHNERISWDPRDFCGITKVSVPKGMLWKPDIFILERTEKDDLQQSLFLWLTYDGNVTLEEDHKVVSTCKMDVYKFPFDTQSCNITFGSVIHSVTDIQIISVSNSTKATQNSREVLLTQGEWEFLNMSVLDTTTTHQCGTWNLLIYTITIKRIPLLHIINLQLPILFFLTLDLASFLISNTKGEKLGFKVTVLLAISVLLLILHDILPSKSDKSPLMATYVIVIFAFMLLSLLETILVTYLIELDSGDEEQVNENTQQPEDSSTKQLGGAYFLREMEDKSKAVSSVCLCGSGGNSPCETLPVMEDSRLLQLILEELQNLHRNLPPLAKEQGKRRFWSRVARRINAAFFVFYLVTILLFLIFIALEWKD